MAQKVLVQLVDDLDGTSSQDVTTVLFGLDGVTYEIDLTEANAERLRESLSEYVESARRVGGRIKRGTRPAAGSKAASANEAAQVREWAQENGFELAGRGRIPSHVVEAYKAAQAETKPKATSPATKRRTRAKKG
ncbi:histone-like nucleoid-structuring protein Lsr2 [Actinophytocola gossypii]|uniref:Lsr2 family protein n=1 Tax=Actinophytocola gossypii TaxID=2812003 RepID=A0ABT2JK15_9PSEU|nr:Lsr2 family protein [Actinophytocola gossypii]MCT2588201.1 Lsr2 family protein [Actinophytocola gossypii]